MSTFDVDIYIYTYIYTRLRNDFQFSYIKKKENAKTN